MDPKKKALIAALESERDALVKSHGRDPEDWNLAIEYLKTGKQPKGVEIEDYDILDGVINDYETTLKDYGIK